LRKQDVAPALREYLVPAEGYPNVLAMVAPDTPRALPSNPRYDAGFARAYAALGRLQASLANIPNADMVTRTLARREAVMSSNIEGTQSDLQQLLTYEATQSEGALAPDVRVTQCYVQALQYGLERVRTEGRRVLDLPLLHELHRMLMGDEAQGRYPVGAWRERQAWIGPPGRIEDATFVPAPPSRIEERMQQMATGILQYAAHEDEQSELTVLAQLAIAHAQFETIHPYHDGNGRTGRLLLPLMLAAEGYPPLYLSGSLLRAKTAYYAALASIQLRGNWDPWRDLLARSVVESCDEAVAIARDLLAVAQGWEQQLETRFRADSAARRLPRLLIGHPVLTVKQAAERLDVTVPAANGALNSLLELGIVELVDPRRRGRLFQATAVLKRLDQQPGG
jgi:Fic family protein